MSTPSQSVSHKRFHQCVNHEKELSLRHPLPAFDSFSFFQASFWLGVNKVLKKLTKSYKSELRHLFQCCIPIPSKCLHKTPVQHTVPPLGFSYLPTALLKLKRAFDRPDDWLVFHLSFFLGYYFFWKLLVGIDFGLRFSAVTSRYLLSFLNGHWRSVLTENWFWRQNQDGSKTPNICE